MEGPAITDHKMGKRGIEKPPLPTTPSKVCSESNNPHFPCGALYRDGYFLTETPFSGVVGCGVFQPHKGRNPLSSILSYTGWTVALKMMLSKPQLSESDFGHSASSPEFDWATSKEFQYTGREK